MWLSAEETATKLKTLPELEALDSFFALSRFWSRAIYPEGYAASPLWKDLLVPTEDGLPYFQEAKASCAGLPEQDFCLATYSIFSHDALIFDWTKSNFRDIHTILDRELREYHIRLPYMFGRSLYDRFLELDVHGRTDHLPYPHVKTLLAESPQGVFQVGYWTSGPLGLIKSDECRLVQPTREIPLWHCSDTGCTAFHQVELQTADNAITAAKKNISGALTSRFGQPSEWSTSLYWRQHRAKWPNGKPYFDLLPFLADRIIGNERSNLLAACLRTNHGSALRTALARAPNGKRLTGGPPDVLAKEVPPEIQLQLLAILPDEVLVQQLDRLLKTKIIVLYPGETRRTRIRPPGNSFSTPTQLGEQGTRSVDDDPCVNLFTLIYQGYTNNNMLSDLEWKIRSRLGSTAVHSLMHYIRTHDPEDVLRELVLPSQTVTQFVCDKLCLDIADVVANEKAAEAMLWKIGYDIPQFGDFEHRFISRLDQFNQALLRNTPIEAEDQREQIRSAGVNLFVSVEELLEKLVVYNAWLLSSDHFIDTKFRFNLATARQTVAQLLGSELSIEQGTVKWNSNGENALGTSLRYLEEAARWVDSLPGADRTPLLRNASQLPFYADRRPRRFPFRHTALWADSDSNELAKFGADLRNIALLLGRSSLVAVRNGLDHKRDPVRFPDENAMLACAGRLKEAFEKADTLRFIPKIFWLYRTAETRYSIKEFECRDYAGRASVFYGPVLVEGIPGVGFGAPFLVCPGDLLGVPNAAIVFSMSEWNDHSLYWEGYPKRRIVPPESKRNQSEAAEASAETHDA